MTEEQEDNLHRIVIDPSEGKVLKERPGTFGNVTPKGAAIVSETTDITPGSPDEGVTKQGD